MNQIINVVQTAESEIAEIKRFVNAVFLFVIVIALIAYLIDLCFDAVASVAEIAVDLIVLK